MNLFLTLAFLFFIGSVFGWVLELFFRRFISSANPERKWINPGFCTGPYLPLYGAGLCILFLIASLERPLEIADPVWEKILLFAWMAVCMTVIEYIAGILSIKAGHVRLWDYSDQWGNIQGIICPKFSLAWAILGAAYYFLIHPHILGALDWLAQNLAFSFVIGMFYGVFIIDLCHSFHLATKLKNFAKENDVVIKYENLKSHALALQEQNAQKYHFFRPFATPQDLTEHLREHLDQIRSELKEDLGDREAQADLVFDKIKKRLDNKK